MSVSWRIDGAVLLESDEKATLEEWKAAVDAALRAPAFERGMAVVHDLRRMFRVPSPQEAQERVDFLARRSQAFGIRRWAIVVAGTAQFGMGRMAEFLSDGAPGVDFRVFREPADAIAWARGEEAEGGNVA
jgi:hypothetical protein